MMGITITTLARSVSPDHSSTSLNYDVFLAAGNLGRQRDLELNVRSDLQVSVGMNVNSSRAYVTGDSLMFTCGRSAMYADRQM